MKKIIYRILGSLLVLGLFVCTVSLPLGNSAQAASIQVFTGMARKPKADLKVMSFTVTQGTCITAPSFLSGYRNVSFSVLIKNIGNKTSPYYNTMITDQNGHIVGGGNATTIPAGQYDTVGLGTILLTPGNRYFTVTVYPLDTSYIPGQSGNPMNYVNWLLDRDASNNTATTKIYLEPCF